MRRITASILGVALCTLMGPASAADKKVEKKAPECMNLSSDPRALTERPFINMRRQSDRMFEFLTGNSTAIQKGGQTVVSFGVDATGRPVLLKTEQSSGDNALDLAGLVAVQMAAPHLKAEGVCYRMAFDYTPPPKPAVPVGEVIEIPTTVMMTSPKKNSTGSAKPKAGKAAATTSVASKAPALPAAPAKEDKPAKADTKAPETEAKKP